MNKRIETYFKKLIHEVYESDCSNLLFIIDIFPKTIDSNKYFQFEKLILDKNAYNILNKYIIALSKIYMYDDDIYFLKKSESEEIIFEKDNGDFSVFLKKVEKSLSFEGNGLDIIFNKLKIGISINQYYISMLKFDNENIDLAINIFKNEQLFINYPDQI